MRRHTTYAEMLAYRSELSPEQERQLQEHLRDCAECRKTADVYARQTLLLRSLPVASAPPTLRAGVFQGIQVQAPRPILPLRWAAPLAAALVIALVAVATFNHSGGHPSRSALKNLSPSRPPAVQSTTVPPATPSPPMISPSRQQPTKPIAHHNSPAPVPAPTPVPGNSASASLAQVLPGRTQGPAYGAQQAASRASDVSAPFHPHAPIATGNRVPHKRAPVATTVKRRSPAPVPAQTPLPIAPVSGGSRTRPTPAPAPTSPVVVLHIRPTPAPAQPPPAYPTPPPAPASHPTPVAAASMHYAPAAPTPTPPS